MKLIVLVGRFGGRASSGLLYKALNGDPTSIKILVVGAVVIAILFCVAHYLE